MTFSFCLIKKKQKIKAAFFLREEIGRIVAKRRGCCLSEASFSTFRYNPSNFFTQKKRGRSCWSLGYAIARVGLWGV